MSVERLAAGCLIAGFEGPRPPDLLRDWLSRGLGGVCLFAWNVESREQLGELTAELRSERPELLVSIDEEGGDVTRLDADRGSSYPGNHALGAVDDVDLTRDVAGAIGAELAAVGVNLDLAPVADVAVNAENPIVGVRSFGSDPDVVARHVAAFVAGLQSAGVAACAKHFPGHGDTREDSHVALPAVERDEEAMQAMLLPFRAAVEAGVRAVMTAHVRISGLDDAPATISRRVIDGLLRGELGFAGLVITDALEMRAISGTVGAEEGAVLALEAGADALCLGHDLRPDGVHRALVDAVRSGRLPEERLVEASGRVGNAVGLPAATRDSPPDIGLEAARRALEVDGDVRLTRRPLVVELIATPSIAAGETNHGLASVLASSDAIRLTAAPLDARALLGGYFDRQLVVVVRDAHRHSWQRVAAKSLLAAAPDGILIELGVPEWRPPGTTYVATHGAGRANLEAAAEALQAG